MASAAARAPATRRAPFRLRAARTTSGSAPSRASNVAIRSLVSASQRLSRSSTVWRRTRGLRSSGKAFTGAQGGGNSIAPGADHFGEVQAWNVDTGRQVWMHPYPKSPNWGAMLTTAGGLVFTGGTADKKIHAFDAATGKLLWEFTTGSGITAPPTTFVAEGKQYLAVHAGWGGDPRGMQAGLNRAVPGEFPPVPEGGEVWVFALPLQ